MEGKECAWRDGDLPSAPSCAPGCCGTAEKLLNVSKRWLLCLLDGDRMVCMVFGSCF